MTRVVDRDLLKSFIKTRENNSHKGDYGHLLLICGSRNMPGAACLATGAALKSGCGLVTLHTTSNAADAAVVSYPSAMLSIDSQDVMSEVPGNLQKYSAIGVGPGLGKDQRTMLAFTALIYKTFQMDIPMVLDADALNLMALNPSLMALIPRGSVLTPHPGELKRLLSWEDENERVEKIQDLCKATGCVLVSKGYRSQVFTPDGEIFENTTGNPGMAKGGSGDVLTGLLAGLLARGYSSVEASLLAVWIHGYAGDCLSEEFTMEAYSSKDLIDCLYKGFKELV